MILKDIPVGKIDWLLGIKGIYDQNLCTFSVSLEVLHLHEQEHDKYILIILDVA